MASAAAKGNVEIAKQMYDAFNTGDMETLLGRMADDVEWVEPEGSRYGGTHRGSTAIMENVFAPVLAEMTTFEVIPQRFIDAGDTVVALGTNRGTIEKSGTTFESTFAQVSTFDDGQLTRFENYADTAVWERAFEA